MTNGAITPILRIAVDVGKKICMIRDFLAPGYSQNGWLLGSGKYTIGSGYRWRMGGST